MHLPSGLVTGSTPDSAFQAEPWRGPTVQPVLHTLDVIGHQALSISADKTLRNPVPHIKPHCHCRDPSTTCYSNPAASDSVPSALPAGVPGSRPTLLAQARGPLSAALPTAIALPPAPGGSTSRLSDHTPPLAGRMWPRTTPSAGPPGSVSRGRSFLVANALCTTPFSRLQTPRGETSFLMFRCLHT